MASSASATCVQQDKGFSLAKLRGKEDDPVMGQFVIIRPSCNLPII